MKQYTHAWLAFMAIERLEKFNFSNSQDKEYAIDLIRWFKGHRDGVVQGAWYPDLVLKDMAKSHIFKLTPSVDASNFFRSLPVNYLSYQYGQKSPLKEQSFSIDSDNNLPDRCEALAQAVIDGLKIQESEDKGSPVSPTDNHIALTLFMLSHYIADAHMPFHCDSRAFSANEDIHDHLEDAWEKEITHYYCLDRDNNRFFYDPHAYPLQNSQNAQSYQTSLLKKVQDSLMVRDLPISWGKGNNNVWDLMSAVCQYSYLISHIFIPTQYTHEQVTRENYRSLGTLSFEKMSIITLSDAINSIALIWFRLWRKILRWQQENIKRK